MKTASLWFTKLMNSQFSHPFVIVKKSESVSFQISISPSLLTLLKRQANNHGGCSSPCFLMTKFQIIRYWQEHHRSDIVSFSVYDVRNHMSLVCPSISSVNFDHLIKVESSRLSTVQLRFSPL